MNAQRTQPFDLHGKVALVTGGTRGIGYAVAEGLGAAGARVVVSSEDASACREAAERLVAAGVDALGVCCDVTDDAQLAALVAQCVAARGGIDVLVCNAGIAGRPGPFAGVSDDDYDRVMAVNLRSNVKLTSLALPGMAARGGGSVILMASLSALRGNKSINVYALSKAALAQLARNLAVEWGPANIRVNAIAPGLIRTEFSRGIMQDEAYFARRLQLTPLRRMGEPEDVAGAAVFLAAPAGAFVTGHTLVVDGGTLITDGN
jgi:NAD(P)-dependent dehydrogenase (short-subunit alcohol dehydrogenase family)